MTVKTAAKILRVSERQIYRMREKVQREGAQALVHGNRGRSPSHTKPVKERQRVVELYQQEYEGYNFTHFAEALESEKGIQVSDETVRRWLRSEGLGGAIRKTKKHRKRRQRKAREGEMVFLDGSPHHWFGNEQSPCTLLLCCDDATGNPLMGLFREQEDRDGCFLVLQRLFKKFGLPQSFYLDRASQFKTTRHGGLHTNQSEEGPTQFQRAMDELGIHIHFAYSPQARGRIERMNGVFQDRLVAELAHRGITSIQEGNGYLNRHFIPSYAKRFGLAARDPQPAWRPVPPGLDLFDVLCVKETRVVTNENTVSYRGSTYQLSPAHRRQHFVKATVEVRCRPDGTIRIHHPTLGRIPARKLSKSGETHDSVQNSDYAYV
jgi:transposase